MFAFVERGKLEYQEKNLSEMSRENHGPHRWKASALRHAYRDVNCYLSITVR